MAFITNWLRRRLNKPVMAELRREQQVVHKEWEYFRGKGDMRRAQLAYAQVTAFEYAMGVVDSDRRG